LESMTVEKWEAQEVLPIKTSAPTSFIITRGNCNT